MTPQNATLDSKRTLSYRRLSAQFQFSLSADTLGYLSQWRVLCVLCLVALLIISTVQLEETAWVLGTLE